jgi:hypothetical protein
VATTLSVDEGSCRQVSAGATAERASAAWLCAYPMTSHSDILGPLAERGLEQAVSGVRIDPFASPIAGAPRVFADRLQWDFARQLRNVEAVRRTIRDGPDRDWLARSWKVDGVRKAAGRLRRKRRLTLIRLAPPRDHIGWSGHSHRRGQPISPADARRPSAALLDGPVAFARQAHAVAQRS